MHLINNQEGFEKRVTNIGHIWILTLCYGYTIYLVWIDCVFLEVYFRVGFDLQRLWHGIVHRMVANNLLWSDQRVGGPWTPPPPSVPGSGKPKLTSFFLFERDLFTKLTDWLSKVKWRLDFPIFTSFISWKRLYHS